MQKKEPNISEGEEFIFDYLKANEIAFEPQQKIHGLKGDTASHRIADFYLKKYGIYIEFLGQWNHGDEHRARYKIKRDVYFKNKIPCIYLYPENLGILDYVFKKRILTELKKHDLKQQLFRWRTNQAYEKNVDYILGFVIALMILIISLVSPIDLRLASVSSIAAILILSRIIYHTVKIFRL